MPVSLPDICDEHLEQLQVVEPGFRDFGGRVRFHGAIVTIKCYEDNTLLREQLGTPGEGRVLVVDGGGSLRRALLGDALARLGRDNGWQGVLINGCVRDVEILSQLDFGVRALAAHPVRSEKRGEGALDTPLHFAGVSFKRGQFLYADANGMVVSTQDLDVDF